MKLNTGIVIQIADVVSFKCEQNVEFDSLCNKSTKLKSVFSDISDIVNTKRTRH